jgi:hypothetical protein
MEQLQPEQLVNMTSDELNKLHKELRYYVDQLDNRVRLTWAHLCLLRIKMGAFEELIDDHELLGAWFSAHARVNDVVVMVTTPEIRLVCPSWFIVLDLTR